MTSAAALSKAKDKNEALTLARDWIASQRDAIKAAFLETGDAAQMLAAQTEMLDALLRGLYDSARGKKQSLPVAVVAVGGYGRAEMFPYSDLDILFLYEPHKAEAAAQLAEYILYVLWDLGLKVGQAHRTVDEALNLARLDTVIRTNMLDARFVAGDRQVFDAFQGEFKAANQAENALSFVEAKLAERDARHQRFGDSRYVLEPNVKEGKGGLRDLHTLWWLASYAYPIDSLRDLVKMRLLSAEEYRNFDRARQFLWRVRAHLHYISGRPEDRLTFDRQHAVAEQMGYGHPSKNRAIERFMRRYFAAVRTVGNVTRIFCALLEDEKKRKPQHPFAWLTNAPWMLGPFRLEGERITVRHNDIFTHAPWLMLELFHVAQKQGLDIHPKALRLVARNLRLVGDELRHDARANAMFLEIMLYPRNVEVTLRRMSESGLLGRFIPDFGRVVGQTQFNMYHVYTVDEHTLFAVGILQSLEQGHMKEEAPLASELIHAIQMRRVLYLALFCHDIAKGQGADHSELGEKVVSKLTARMGFTEAEIETAAWLVRYHLLFSNTAFKRDLNDPKTIADFVAEVQSPERMRLLLILTVADIRAVGPAVWNEWKATLLRDLYTRAEQFMGTGHVVMPRQQTEQLRADLRARLPGWSEEELDDYIEQGNPGFWNACDVSHHATIARMLRQAQHMKLPLLIDTQHDHVRGITEFIICTFDQHELFSKIAGAISLGGANIINAKIFTLKGGMAIDVFQVQDVSYKAFDRPDRLAKVAVYIEQALSGELKLADMLAKRSLPLDKSRNVFTIPGQVFIANNASNIYSVIELSGRDRAGFLYDVTRAIAELGLSVATAHISTYGTQVSDVFYVKDIFGMKILHETKLRQVRERLLEAVNKP